MKRLIQIGASVVVLGLVVVLLPRPGKAPEEIRKTAMAEFGTRAPTLIDRVASTASEVIQLPVVNTRRKQYLRVGRTQMEWSLMNHVKKTGWLYFDKPDTDEPIWEFAACARANLIDITAEDLEVEFIRKHDTNGIAKLFPSEAWNRTGRNLSGRAIPVHEEQIVLARRVRSPRTIYAIKLMHQGGDQYHGIIHAEYLELDRRRAEPRDAPNEDSADAPSS